MRISIYSVFLLMVSTIVVAQDYTGTYSVQNQQGEFISLTVKQEAQGTLSGSMSGYNQQYQLEGMVEEGIAVGAIYNNQGGVFFEAQLQGSELHLTLIEPGSDSAPDYSKMQDLVLTRQGAPSTTPATATPAGGSALLGLWSCQTPLGAAQLNFVSASQLIFNGESTPYEITDNVLRVPGDWGPVEYHLQLQENRLTILNPDGSTSQCQRQQSGGQTGGSVGRGTGMEAHLQGLLCSYSSSPDGGFSTQHLLQFNGQGRFWYGLETAWDIPATTGVSRNWDNGENVGSYQVTATNKGAAVYLHFADGQVGTARVYHVYQGSEITELFLEGPDRHYAKSLCP